MRLLYFLAHPDIVGGASRQMIIQAMTMRDRGNEVRLIIQSNDDGSYNDEYDRLCKIHNLDYSALFFSVATCIEKIDIIKSIEISGILENIIDEYKPDIIHSLQLNTTVEMITRKKAIPHVFSIYPISDGMFNIKWRDVFPRFHTCDSNLFCKQWAKGLNVESKCVRVIYNSNGINDQCDSMPRRKNGDRRFELVNIAHFAPHKQQLEILRLLLLCREKGIDVHLSFLGDDTGEYADECKKYVYENGIEDIVTFEGFVEDVVDCLGKFDLMILASTTESYPGVIVEAMANKIPILCTPVGGVSELLHDGISAFISEDYSAESILDKFCSFIRAFDNKTLEGIIENAYETYLNNHTPKVVGALLEDYYGEILSDEDNVINKDEGACFLDDIKAFYADFDLEHYSEYTRAHCWYLYHLKHIIKSDKSIYIWGAGNFGKIGIEWSRILGLKVKGILDEKGIGKFEGYNVYRPSYDRIKEVKYIIVAVAKAIYVEQIMAKLNSCGLVRNIDYFLVSNDPCYSSILRS